MTTFSNVVDAVKSFGSSAAAFAKSRPQEIALAASSALTAGAGIASLWVKERPLDIMDTRTDDEKKSDEKKAKVLKMLAAVGLVGVAASTAALVHKLRGTGKKPEIVDGGPTKPAVPLKPGKKPGRKPVYPGPWNPRY